MLQASYQVAIVEIILEADAGAQEAHGCHNEPLFASVQKLQHLFHHIVAQHIVPAGSGNIKWTGDNSDVTAKRGPPP